MQQLKLYDIVGNAQNPKCNIRLEITVNIAAEAFGQRQKVPNTSTYQGIGFGKG